MENSMQKEIQLTDKTLLVVGFYTTNSIFIQSGLTSKDPIAFKYLASTETIVIPDDEYELLGIYPELTEEQSKSVVESYYGGTKFHNYIGDMMLDTAKESFQSLMEREKCYTVNPYGEKPILELNFMNKQGYLNYDGFELALGKWKEAQQTTFDKYAILIKIK